MAIPDYETIMLPLLRWLADGKVRHLRESIDAMAAQFELTPEELEQRLPSGVKRTFDDRVSWASTYMKKAGLLTSPKRGDYQITERGRTVLSDAPQRITDKYLEGFAEFLEFRTRRKNRRPKVAEAAPAEKTPDEAILDGYVQLRDNLAADVLAAVKECSPAFFESLVIDLLVRMGYGGTREDAGRAIGKTGDGGIDGIIKEDRLGLDVIYLQAKRWDAPVGRPEVQKFAGALQGRHAKKGVFITTSSFTKDAISFASGLESKIVLIDGEQMADLMIDHEIGTTAVATYAVKRIDTDYFTEE